MGIKVETKLAKSSKADKELWASKGITDAEQKLTYNYVPLAETALFKDVETNVQKIVDYCKGKVGSLPPSVAPGLVQAMDNFGVAALKAFTSVTIQAEAARQLSGLEFAPRDNAPSTDDGEPAVEVQL